MQSFDLGLKSLDVLRSAGVGGEDDVDLDSGFWPHCSITGGIGSAGGDEIDRFLELLDCSLGVITEVASDVICC